MKLTNTSSLVLDNLRVPLAIAVLMCHTISSVLKESIIVGSSSVINCVSYYLLMFFNEALPPLIVPGFFLLSGFFFFLKWTEDDGVKKWDWAVYRNKLYSRVFTLLIPYIIWNMVPVALGLIGSVIDGQQAGDSLFDTARSYMQGKGLRIFGSFYVTNVSETKMVGVPLRIDTAPFNFPLYYIRDLMSMSVLSPIIFWSIKRFKHYLLIVLFIIGLFGYLPSYPGFRSTAVLYFTIGAFFSINNIDIVEQLKGSLFPWVLASFTLLFIIILDKYQSSFRFIYVFVGLLTLLRTVQLVVTKHSISVPKQIIESVFFVYVAHEGMYILQSVRNFILEILPSQSYFHALIQYILIVCITFIVCVSLRLFIIKAFPRIGLFIRA